MANTALGAEKEVNEHFTFLSDELIAWIMDMRNDYSDYSHRADAVRRKLKQEVWKYLDESELWSDKAAILEISHWLPNGCRYHELDDALFDILQDNEYTQDETEESVLSAEIVETLRVMRRAYKRNFEKASRIQNKMRKHIARYMDEHELWGNQKAVQEVIEILPSGYLRFQFYMTYYDLEKEKNGEAQEEN